MCIIKWGSSWRVLDNHPCSVCHQEGICQSRPKQTTLIGGITSSIYRGSIEVLPWDKRILHAFHVQLKVVQSIVVPVVLYYLPLLPWSKKTLEMVWHSIWILLWKRKRKIVTWWLAWNHFCTPKPIDGALILNLYDHTVAHRFTFIQFMFEDVQPCTKMMALLYWEIKFGDMKAETNLWDIINSKGHVKCLWFVLVNHLLTSW